MNCKDYKRWYGHSSWDYCLWCHHFHFLLIFNWVEVRIGVNFLVLFCFVFFGVIFRIKSFEFNLKAHLCFSFAAQGYKYIYACIIFITSWSMFFLTFCFSLVFWCRQIFLWWGYIYGSMSISLNSSFIFTWHVFVNVSPSCSKI